MTLAILAVAIKVLIPPGFMAAAPANGQPLPLVICTGHGAMVLGPGDAFPGRSGHSPAPAGKSHDSPCAFAGHGVAAPPPALTHAGEVTFIAYLALPSQPAPDLRPGRGLTGPPLPARGPPFRLI